MSLIVECPILQDVTNNPAFVVPCGCKFDAAAITEWSQRDNRCPNDRTVMQQICLLVTQEPVIDRRVYLAPEKGARFRELQPILQECNNLSMVSFLRVAKRLRNWPAVCWERCAQWGSVLCLKQMSFFCLRGN